jgi:hypothetical protein
VSAKIFLGRQRTADSLKTAQTFTVLSQVLFGNCSACFDPFAGARLRAGATVEINRWRRNFLTIKPSKKS